MTTVQAIEAAVEQLAPEQRAEFRAWFEAFDAREWDLQMEQDLQSGRLDWLAGWLKRLLESWPAAAAPIGEAPSKFTVLVLLKSSP
jgi:hypothetical protein